jgi:hypothetical protein
MENPTLYTRRRSYCRDAEMAYFDHLRAGLKIETLPLHCEPECGCQVQQTPVGDRGGLPRRVPCAQMSLKNAPNMSKTTIKFVSQHAKTTTVPFLFYFIQQTKNEIQIEKNLYRFRKEENTTFSTWRTVFASWNVTSPTSCIPYELPSVSWLSFVTAKCTDTLWLRPTQPWKRTCAKRSAQCSIVSREPFGHPSRTGTWAPPTNPNSFPRKRRISIGWDGTRWRVSDTENTCQNWNVLHKINFDEINFVSLYFQCSCTPSGIDCILTLIICSWMNQFSWNFSRRTSTSIETRKSWRWNVRSAFRQNCIPWKLVCIVATKFQSSSNFNPVYQ